MKRLLRTTISALGEIDTDAYIRAILQFRNTPDPSTGTSPAELIFGRALRDTLPVKPRTQVFDNELVRNIWTDSWKKREQVLLSRSQQQMEKLSQNCREYIPLYVGDYCLVQNQTGRFSKRWDKRGLIVETLPNNQYLIRLDGSRRLTLRNRKFLRKSPPMMQNDSQHLHNQATPQTPQNYTPISVPSTDLDSRTNTPQTPVRTSLTVGNRLSTSTPCCTDMSMTFDNDSSMSTPHHTRTSLSDDDRLSPPATTDVPPSSPTTVDNRSPVSTRSCETEREASQTLRPRRTTSTPTWHKDYEMGAILSVSLY